MQISVKLFARAKDLAGTDTLHLDLPDTARVADLKHTLAERCPNLIPLLPSLLVALNNNYAQDTTPLSASAEIACFPPVSGG